MYKKENVMIAQQASHMKQTSQMLHKVYAVLEVLLVYALIQALIVSSRSIDLVQREIQVFGWSYIVAFSCFVLIPALIIWLARRNWAEYGASLRENWRTNLDIGIKAFLVLMIPHAIGRGGATFLGLSPQMRDRVIDITWVIAIAVMIWVMNRHKPVASGKNNLIFIAVLLLLPILIALWMKKLSVVVVSTILWQFLLSGFGEEFAFRGYLQSRLNHAFGRPLHLFGIQFGVGLIIASFLFGLLHAFNDYDPAVGFASLGWSVLIGNTIAGFFFGIIREKTGTLLAPSIAHGLPDALGEPMMKIFDWVMY
jgi:membrane protease YdiL (CAAX protease family)